MKSYKTTDEYIDSFPPDVQKLLVQLRKTIREALPDETTEKISYGIPTFYLNGNLIHFGGFKNHVSIFPGSRATEEFKVELRGYRTSKGTVQFPLDKPLPLDLIKQVAAYCARN